jgi:hypothetical protein
VSPPITAAIIVTAAIILTVTAHLVDLDADIYRPQTRDVLRQPVLERGDPACRTGEVSQLKPSLTLEGPSEPPSVLRQGGFSLLLIAWELEDRAGLFKSATNRELCYPRNRRRTEPVRRRVPRR